MFNRSRTEQLNNRFVKRKHTYFVSITVHLTSYLICLDSAALLMFNEQQIVCLVKSKQVKQEVSHTVISLLMN